MLKEAVASKAAKLLMTCVCPVAGTTALTLGVPQARDAVHKAVQPHQYAKPKTRIRQQIEEATQVASAEECATPVAISDIPLTNPDVPVTSLASTMSAAGDGASRVAQIPAPEAGIPLTPRIFIPKRVAASSDKETGKELTAWVELFLGAG